MPVAGHGGIQPATIKTKICKYSYLLLLKNNFESSALRQTVWLWVNLKVAELPPRVLERFSPFFLVIIAISRSRENPVTGSGCMILARTCPPRAGGKTEKYTTKAQRISRECNRIPLCLCAFVVTFLLAVVRKQVPGHACGQTLNCSGFSRERGISPGPRVVSLCLCVSVVKPAFVSTAQS